MKKIPGQCHCGKINFVFTWPADAGTLPARACSCSFCTKHGAVYTSHPDGLLDVEIEDVGHVNRYQFGQKSADFIICQECGVIVFALSEIDGNEYAVININTFKELDPNKFDRVVTNFDTESHAERLGRRQRNWTGTVSMRVKVRSRTVK